MKTLAQYINEYLIKKKLNKVYKNEDYIIDEIIEVMQIDKNYPKCIELIREWVHSQDVESVEYYLPNAKSLTKFKRQLHHKFDDKIGDYKTLDVSEMTKNSNIVNSTWEYDTMIATYKEIIVYNSPKYTLWIKAL